MCHLPEDLVSRLLTAAHSAPSVGLMQLSRFIVIRDPAVRSDVYGIFEQANTQAAFNYTGEPRAVCRSQARRNPGGSAESLRSLRFRQRPRAWARTPDNARDRALLERYAQSTTFGSQSAAKRWAWASNLDPEKLREVLHIPAHLTLVAYLCLHYVNGFDSEPDLERHGWERRVPVDLPVRPLKFRYLQRFSSLATERHPWSPVASRDRSKQGWLPKYAHTDTPWATSAQHCLTCERRKISGIGWIVRTRSSEPLTN
jgi:5,6-dimethylbenzimidazole synthase